MNAACGYGGGAGRAYLSGERYRICPCQPTANCELRSQMAIMADCLLHDMPALAMAKALPSRKASRGPNVYRQGEANSSSPTRLCETSQDMCRGLTTERRTRLIFMFQSDQEGGWEDRVGKSALGIDNKEER